MSVRRRSTAANVATSIAATIATSMTITIAATIAATIAIIMTVAATTIPASAGASAKQPAAPTARQLSVTVSARPAVIKPMQRMHLTGVVGPRAGGAVVTVQVKDGTWKAVPGARRKADGLGRYAIDVWSNERGTFSLRVVGALGKSSGTSKPFTMTVR